jgi:glutamate N-acetyltransferase / amino-acid N-acetyltransferase
MSKTITDIDGVYAGSIHAGIKDARYDLSYIFVPEAVASAGVFTQNKFCSSSVKHTRKYLKNNTLKAMIINSGNANTGTGKEGEENNKKMARLTADALGIPKAEVGVSSTGIIGVQLPFERVEKGIKALLQSPLKKDGQQAAEGIMTTDTFSKTVYKEAKVGKKTITVAGIAKGSGMIKPNMATMLAYIVTNANINTKLLQTCLKEAVDYSFNSITVDTDTSTSDMVMAFATGEKNFSETTTDLAEFKALLKEVCIDLAKLIIQDGEGATKLIEVTVEGARTHKDAKEVAMSVADSPLVKTAIHGEDPNWGRLIMAIGKSPTATMNPDKVNIELQGTELYKKGEPTDFDYNKVKKSLEKKEIELKINLNCGKSWARVWGCDLTHGYIDINVDYN